MISDPVPRPLPTPPHVLLRDGTLRLEAPADLVPLLESWLPLLPYAERQPAPNGVVVRISRGVAPGPTDDEPHLRFGSVTAWVDGAMGIAILHGTRAGCGGHVDLRGKRAELVAPRDIADTEAAGWELHSLATLSCALLLSRMGRALVHAAAVVAPDGGCWLLAGDTHSGKSTTAVNLIAAGWRFVSDDNVVLARGADGTLEVEGWPRRFHLDVGWEAGAPAGRRGAVDPRERWPGQWVASAPLAGLLFPEVRANEPTAAAPIAAVEALAALLRQSPWLVADRGSAATVLALLRDTAALPAYRLQVGLDTYSDPPLLVERLARDTGR